jgi:adenylate kinase family enzyme
MSHKKAIPAELIVRLLKRIIYSGDGRKKFILSGFPMVPEIMLQIQEFEKQCASISAVIYPANETSAEKPTIQIKNNNLGLYDIEAHFSKENKLKTLSRWDDQKWSELVGGSKIDWSIVLGMPFQGRSTLAGIISKSLGFKLVDWKAVELDVKKSLGTEEEPFEGKVPLAKVEDAVVKLIENDRKSGVKAQYIFDFFPLHQTGEEFYQFTSDKLKCAAPDFLFDLRNSGVTMDLAMSRYKKKLEAEELSEEQKTGFHNDFISSEVKVLSYIELIAAQVSSGRVRLVSNLRTDAASEETQVGILKSLLKPRVLLVHHEK